MTRTRYYVGLSRYNGQPVTPEQIREVQEVISNAYGGGSTTYQATGYWKGTREDCIVVEVVGDFNPAHWSRPADLARAASQIAGQSTVLWTREEVEGGFAS